jgi:hypothetical protein
LTSINTSGATFAAAEAVLAEEVREKVVEGRGGEREETIVESRREDVVKAEGGAKRGRSGQRSSDA